MLTIMAGWVKYHLIQWKETWFNVYKLNLLLCKINSFHKATLQFNYLSAKSNPLQTQSLKKKKYYFTTHQFDLQIQF